MSSVIILYRGFPSVYLSLNCHYVREGVKQIELCPLSSEPPQPTFSAFLPLPFFYNCFIRLGMKKRTNCLNKKGFSVQVGQLIMYYTPKKVLPFALFL